MLSVGVIGAAGRMGRAVCDAVQSAEDLELVARIDRGDSLDGLTAGGAEVAVEFTRPDSVKENIRWCIHHGIHAVVGTTGLTAEALAEVEDWTKGASANVFVAPNFAIGAVLMMHFAALAAPHFSSAEIVERHHEGKLDSPSGTSLRTAELMHAARSEPWARKDADKSDPARGHEVDGISIHSLRLPGSVAHQEVILGGLGETLTIRHDSLDRSSFMPGVLLAVRSVGSRPGLTVGLEKLLDL